MSTDTEPNTPTTRGTDGHTDADWMALNAAGIDPATTQPREQAVQCFGLSCGRMTFNQAGGCDAHYQPPPAVARAAAATERVQRALAQLPSDGVLAVMHPRFVETARAVVHLNQHGWTATMTELGGIDAIDPDGHCWHVTIDRIGRAITPSAPNTEPGVAHFVRTHPSATASAEAMIATFTAAKAGA